MLSIFAALASGWYFLAGIPLLFLAGYVAILDFKKLFFLLFALIPFSTEVELPGGFGTDLPTEPLILLLTGIYILYVLRRGKDMNSDFLRHPLTLILLLHVGWIAITTLTSGMFVVSLKFLLAKLWYLVTFYFLAGTLIKTEKDVRILVWSVFIPLMTTVVIVLLRHAQYQFDFGMVNKVLSPFYRNHVNYACLMALFFPVIWLATGWYKAWSAKWWMLAVSMLILLVGIYFSYTRAAYVALFIAVAAYYVIRLRWMKWMIGLALAGVIALLAYLADSNNYLRLAPDYNKAISHESFDNLLEATYKGEDISTMERVYRWVAGFQMIKEKHLTGYGPGNFVNFYKSYTIHSFRTYVSHNPERSGIHSYYLMTMVEQGIPGLILFLVLAFYFLIRGERIYHETADPLRRRIVLMALLSMVVIDTLLIINDMIETDKVGPFFFLCIALLVNWDLKNRQDAKNAPNPMVP